MNFTAEDVVALIRRKYSDARKYVVMEQVCDGTGRFIGIELDPHWAQVARERVGLTALRGPLFCQSAIDPASPRRQAIVNRQSHESA